MMPMSQPLDQEQYIMAFYECEYSNGDLGLELNDPDKKEGGGDSKFSCAIDTQQTEGVNGSVSPRELPNTHTRRYSKNIPLACLFQMNSTQLKLLCLISKRVPVRFNFLL